MDYDESNSDEVMTWDKEESSNYNSVIATVVAELSLEPYHDAYE